MVGRYVVVLLVCRCSGLQGRLLPGGFFFAPQKWGGLPRRHVGYRVGSGPRSRMYVRAVGGPFVGRLVAGCCNELFL